MNHLLLNKAISIETVEAYAEAAKSLGITAILAIDQPSIIQKLESMFDINVISMAGVSEYMSQ